MMQHPHAATGRRTMDLLQANAAELRERGGALLLRHSAREYVAGRHDLLNPLTDVGRELAELVGAGVPGGLTLRGYASPAERCIETAERMLAAYRRNGGQATRTRPMEALGVFYALDQMKMFKSFQAEGGLRGFVGRWVSGRIADDIMMPAPLAVGTLLKALYTRLPSAAAVDALGDGESARLDVCVSHDLTLQVVRAVTFALHAPQDIEVEFLDAILLIDSPDGIRLLSHDRETRLDSFYPSTDTNWASGLDTLNPARSSERRCGFDQ